MVNKPPIVPAQDGLRNAGTPDEHDLGNEIEREASPRRTAAGEPSDAATHNAGARPAGAPRLPHEHDEYADAPSTTRPVIAQAEQDIEAGLEDTDCRGTPSAFGRRKPGGHCP